MRVEDLTREQLTELKERFYTSKNDNVSWEELANVDSLVSDSEVFEEYGATTFTSDDFFCTCGQEN